MCEFKPPSPIYLVIEDKHLYAVNNGVKAVSTDIDDARLIVKNLTHDDGIKLSILEVDWFSDCSKSHPIGDIV